MSPWALTFEGYEPDQERFREALCTLGNGYLGSRGAAPESSADDVHYPGTYVAGVYNRLTTEVADRDVENEDLVNVPSWLPLTFRIDDGPWLDLDRGDVEVLEHRQTLELRRGVLVRRLRIRDADGRETSVAQRRFVHLAHHHLAGLETTIRSEGWSGRLTIRSGIDGTVTNEGVERYRDLAGDHLEVLDTAHHGDGEVVVVRARTTQSRVEVVTSSRTRVDVDQGDDDLGDDDLAELRRGGDHAPGGAATPSAERAARASAGAAEVELQVDLAPGHTCRVEKLAAIHTSRDTAISEPGTAAVDEVGRAGSFDELLRAHVAAWDDLWRRFEIDLGNGEQHGDRTSLVLNLHIFHLLQVAAPATMDLDVGIPARGLHGEAYRGHIFWDELFAFPLLTYRYPEIARALLRYRYRRLPAARRLAADEGHAGAMFPWQSGSSGREESQELHLNPESGRWLPDETHRQRHIGSAIAYNVWQYVEVTGDLDFLADTGADLVLEIARFWASIAEHDPVDDRYDIVGVVGPDEFHPDDPGWDGPGLRNNAYTNVMAAWVLANAPRLLDRLPGPQREATVDRLGLRAEELERWDDISRKLRVPFHDGVISQFQGYEDLAELDWEGYRERYGDIHRLDRILEAEGDDVTRYQASKQADVLMLWYLLPGEEVRGLLERLGYQPDEGLLERTVDHYLRRTSHGSTLSRVVHSWVLATSDPRRSYELFCRSLDADIGDSQGGTTEEGVHLGAMAGTVDLATRGYTGMAVRDGALWFVPRLPVEIDRVRFPIYYRHRWIDVCLDADGLRLTSEQTEQTPVTVCCVDRTIELASGDSVLLGPARP